MSLIAIGSVRSRCSATAGISSSDRMLRIQVTGRDDDNVHYRDNSSALTGRWRVINQTQELQHPIESREVLERRQRDRTCPISCSATTGVSSSDRTLSEAVTGRTNFTVHHHGNILSVTGCDGRTTGRIKK